MSEKLREALKNVSQIIDCDISIAERLVMIKNNVQSALAEPEVCEWIYDYEYCLWSPKCLDYFHKTKHKHCPHCGRKIEVTETTKEKR